MKKQLKTLICSFSGALLLFSDVLPQFNTKAQAFPIYAQQAYANPREANGRIACANCHLAQKSVAIESPGSVLPDQVFL